MTIEQKYISFDGQTFCREDLCLKHERDVIDQGVFLFDETGNQIDLTWDNFEHKAKLIYIKEGAEQSFNDLGYRNCSAGYQLKFSHGWYIPDENGGWLSGDTEVRMINRAQYIINERLGL